MNSAQTVQTARKKIEQLRDSNDLHDFIHRRGVAEGWLAALRVENLVDTLMHRTLMDELNDEATEVIDSLNQNAQEGCGCPH
ncbi:hypothetical protein ALO83_103655 [Pseudomonas cannabina pv. alisalensis]|uniref:Uncharacterized protein n=1 Tax=Pseudomonas cannabina TaxID=86840 RepID=A0AB37Q5E9_PSECA|nr:hypothetical protein [Pseudomonas cannabina]KPW23122.1 hypothetical protein ALO83_103655 [Pseudomonas cannabina pv. alisalensis]RMN76653.1 hypothetical protein ALQ53_200144 [Pseudomonas cannabina]RMN81547.1 hypothetical protein ALQ52_104315 [Pseudomonas cannabina pv. alisalensis]